MSPVSTEELLRETLGDLARQVDSSPTAYRRAAAKWRRREQRRRLYVAILAGVIIVIADIVGLWALNHATSEGDVLWDAPPPAGAPAAPGHIVTFSMPDPGRTVSTAAASSASVG